MKLFSIFDPSDTRTISSDIYELIGLLKKERYIYGYDGGPGGGGGGTLDLMKQDVLPAFNFYGDEGIYLKVSRLKRIILTEKIVDLFNNGETEQSFKASEWTTITTRLKLIEDKSKLPETSSWSTMRD